jgi:hypothetical protein
VQGTISGGGKMKQGGMSTHKKKEYSQADLQLLETQISQLR